MASLFNAINFSYLCACAQNGHMTTNIVSISGLMTERDAVPG